MQLVDYGSGSESEDDAPRPDPSAASAPPATSTAKPKATSLASMLPPPSKFTPQARGNKPAPKSRKLQLPALAASTLQAVADLDNKSSEAGPNGGKGADGEERPARKRPRLGGEGGKGGGLAAMLPPPKNPPTKPAASALAKNGASTAPVLSEPAAETPAAEKASVVEEAPAVDFFGLGSVSSSTATSSTRPSAAPSVPSACPSADPPSATGPSLSISSAPMIADEQPPPPSLLDPYPGYWQRQSGEWVARDPTTDPLWAAFYEEHYARRPEINVVEEEAITGGKQMVEFDAAEEARQAREARPEIIDPREEARKEAEAEAETKPQKAISRVAKGRHQLTSLLSDARTNRADLEERIARGKLNRRAAGARYGF